MHSRLALAVLIALAFSAGCRDLVTPEGATNQGYPVLRLQIFGLGSDGALVDARVRIDNSNYAPEAYVVTAETTTTAQGIAWFEDAPPGLYDVEVTPDRWHHSTPDWSVEGLVLGDSAAVVAYWGVPCSFELVWPRLDEFAPANRATTVNVTYSLDPTRPGPWDATQKIFPDEHGIHRGYLPWEGNFQVEVVTSGPSFNLQYNYPDSLPLSEGDHVKLASPIQAHAIDLRFGDEPVTAARLEISHRSDRSSFHPGSSSIRYMHDRSAHPDSLFLMKSVISVLNIEWVEGPAFLERSMWLEEGPVLPEVIDLGRYRFTLRVADEDANPVPATVEAWTDERTASWLTDDAGTLDLRTFGESIGLTVTADGFEPWESVIHGKEAADIDIVLVREAP